jgi:hypothetical protein
MKWPPYVMKLRFHKGNHDFGLWIPLFLIGPVALVFLLVVFAILLPFALLAFMFTWQWDWLSWVAIGIPTILRVAWSLPGVKIDVDAEDVKVSIAIS